MQVPTKSINDDNIIQNTHELLAPSDDKDKTTTPSKSNSKDVSTIDDKPLSQANVPKDRGSDGSVEDALVAKLQWASRELAAAQSVEDSTQLCLLIKACAEALKSVRELDGKPHASVVKTRSDTNS